MRTLEIGCGEFPTVEDGWDHLDSRHLPHVNLVQSAVDLSNIPNGTYDRVMAKDIVEHLPWRDVMPALREWVRVLASGGQLEVETPNAKEVVELIARPGNPDVHRLGGESDWERFCRVTFGHQDCPENFHASYFTWEWLTEMLLTAGASAVETVWCTLARFRLRATR